MLYSFHGRESLIPVSLMRSLRIRGLQPLVEVSLKRIKIIIAFLSKRHIKQLSFKCF